jgi:hypothetical protein
LGWIREGVKACAAHGGRGVVGIGRVVGATRGGRRRVRPVAVIGVVALPLIIILVISWISN